MVSFYYMYAQSRFLLLCRRYLRLKCLFTEPQHLGTQGQNHGILVSKFGQPESPANFSAVKDTAKQKKQGEQTETEWQKDSECERTSPTGEVMQTGVEQENFISSAVSPLSSAYITHVSLVLQLYFLINRGESVMPCGWEDKCAHCYLPLLAP